LLGEGIVSYMLGLLTGVIITFLKDILSTEYRKWRSRIERVEQIREELKASAISLCNTWYTFGKVETPYLDLRREILEAIKEMLEYLNYYEAYGGRKKAVSNIREILHRITDLTSKDKELTEYEWSIRYGDEMDKECKKLLKAVRSA